MSKDREYAALLRRGWNGAGWLFQDWLPEERTAMDRAIELLEEQVDPMLWYAQNEPES